MKTKSVVSFLMIVVMGAVLSPNLFAAMSCRFVHKKEISWETTTKQVRLPRTGDLDIEKMKKYGFSMKRNHLIDKDGTNLGRLQVLDVKFLYEWASQQYHEAWIKTGGIDDAYMKRVLAAKEQLVGKGFYVSLHPTDSSAYGNALTVFPVSRPLVILTPNDFVSLSVNTRLQIHLGKAGVDSYVNPEKDLGTWLPIISSQHLQNPKDFESTLAPLLRKGVSRDQKYHLLQNLEDNNREEYMGKFRAVIPQE